MTTLEPKSRSHRQKNSSSLLPYFIASLAIHGLAVLIITRVERSQPIVKQQQDSKPIEFVIVPPQETPDKPPPETKRRAINNSLAQGKIKSEKSSTTEKKDHTATDSSSSLSKLKVKPTKAVKPIFPVAVKPKPVEPTLPKKAEPNPAVATRLPPQPKPLKSTPTPSSNSGAASLLGGSYQKSIQDDSGSSFFNLEASASKEAPYAQLDAQQDDVAPYFAEIRRRIKQNWQPESPEEEQFTVLNFAIQRNGQITGLRVAETSGEQQVDRDALEAVQKSAPFDILPQSFKRDHLEIQFSFNIYIHQGSF